MDRHVLQYDPSDWYWKCTDGRLFSSKSLEYVDEADSRYQRWLAFPGHTPTRFPTRNGVESMDALQEEVLVPNGVPTTPVLADALYRLNSSGTYHLPTCGFASESGRDLTLAAIRSEHPNAKPCSRCNPPALADPEGIADE